MNKIHYVILALAFVAVIGFATLQEQSLFGLKAPRATENLPSYITEQMKTCARSGASGWRGACFRELGRLISERFPLEETMRALDLIDEEPGVKEKCHSLAHYVATNEYDRSGDLGETIRKASVAFACSSGAFHGAVEGLISAQAGDLSTSTIASVCARSQSPNDLSYFACNHGLGHAFMLVGGNNLTAALGGCDVLNGADERGYCYTGVFMEETLSFESADHPSNIDPKDPAALCRTLPARLLSACYEAASVFVFRQSAYDYGAVANFCESVPSAQRRWCYTSLGAGTPLLFDDPLSVKVACDYAPPGEMRSYCLVGAVEFLAQNVGGDVSRVLALCKGVDTPYADACYSLAGETLARWYPGERATICAEAGPLGSRARAACHLAPELP